MNTTPPALPADLESGLRRLRLGAMRRLAPELLVVAKTQRWKPEELLRTLVEAEITSRDASNARGRMKAAAFPVRKTLDEFDVAALLPATLSAHEAATVGAHEPAALAAHGGARPTGLSTLSPA